jgi:hypothetical protein
MILRKTAVLSRMPVLRRYDQIKVRHESIHHRYNLISTWHRERTAGHEVVLDVDEEQGFHDC